MSLKSLSHAFFMNQSLGAAVTRTTAVIFCLMLLSAMSAFARSDCLSIHEALLHVGEVKCVTGKVVRVTLGDEDVHVFDFCQDPEGCPFTVVVFPSDLEDVGEVTRLEGRTIEIRGKVKAYNGRAEIVLRRISQLRRGSAMVPPLPRNYDVENRGHYSPGRFHHSKKPKKIKEKPATTAIYGNDVEGEDPPD
jgi:hypothetical protein